MLSFRGLEFLFLGYRKDTEMECKDILIVASNQKAGDIDTYNHNEILAIQSRLRAGECPRVSCGGNHNESLRRP